MRTERPLRRSKCAFIVGKSDCKKIFSKNLNVRVTFCVRNAIDKVDQREWSVKSMKRMHSEEEIRAYLNQAEPITDAEVERFYERLKPKLLREI